MSFLKKKFKTTLVLAASCMWPMNTSSSRLIDFTTDVICLLKMLTQLPSALLQHLSIEGET